MTTPSMNAAEAETFIIEFLAAWRGRDIEHLMSFFAADAVYHNVPVAPIEGEAGIRKIFEGFLSAFIDAALDIVTIASKPDLVLTERIDRFTMEGGRKIVLPVNGVFEIRARKIVRFSDYFDLASFERQSGLKL